MHLFPSVVFRLLAVVGLHVSVQGAGRRPERSANRHFTSMLTVSNGMTWGSWGQGDICPSDTYAMGFSLKVEKPVYFDNTDLNGIRLYCVSRLKDLRFPSEDVPIQSDVGRWGEWTKAKWCPSGFLTAFQLRVESSQVFEDNVAASNVRFNCSEGFVLEGDGTDRGEWGDWSSLCQARGICGIMTRVEKPQGFGDDDTALNDARMFCCE